MRTPNEQQAEQRIAEKKTTVILLKVANRCPELLELEDPSMLRLQREIEKIILEPDAID